MTNEDLIIEYLQNNVDEYGLVSKDDLSDHMKNVHSIDEITVNSALKNLENQYLIIFYASEKYPHGEHPKNRDPNQIYLNKK